MSCEAIVVVTGPDTADVVTAERQGPAGPNLLPAYTADDIGKVLGVIDDGDGNPILAWVEAGTVEPAYSPSLNYSDGRNSQYALFPLLAW